MKTLGIIGGIAPESTIEYYRAIVTSYRRGSGGRYPSIIINSIDLTKMIGLVGGKHFEELIEYLLAELQRLADAGAHLGLFASNTPHIVFDELHPRSPIPLISIVEAACDQAIAMKLHKLALFGTRFTMQADFYPHVFARNGIEVVRPDADDQEVIHTRYMDELVAGNFRDETRDELLAIMKRMRDAHGIDGVILGGTELPLLLRRDSWEGMAFLDTGRVHVARAVEALLDCGNACCRSF
jgi:aspartate racemase